MWYVVTKCCHFFTNFPKGIRKKFNFIISIKIPWNFPSTKLNTPEVLQNFLKNSYKSNLQTKTKTSWERKPFKCQKDNFLRFNFKFLIILLNIVIALWDDFLWFVKLQYFLFIFSSFFKSRHNFQQHQVGQINLIDDYDSLSHNFLGHQREPNYWGEDENFCCLQWAKNVCKCNEMPRKMI